MLAEEVSGSKNSMTVLILNILSVVVLLVFNLSSMRVTLVGVWGRAVV